MLFPVKVQYYKGLTKALKGAAAVIPMPKPTLFSGADASLELCDAISHLGIQKLLLVTDKVLVEIGLLKDIEARLAKHGIKVVIYDGILPDPTYDQVEAGLELLKKNKCEGILAVGGGSPIDASKAIAARATNNKPLEKMAGLFKLRSAPLPLFVVPTTAGTGSEVTIVSVVSDPETHQKTPIIDPKLVPAMAALDGKLMLGLPPSVTAATGMDALTHAIESYISTNATDETRSYALAATKLIMENLETAVHDGKNFEARQTWRWLPIMPASPLPKLALAMYMLLRIILVRSIQRLMVWRTPLCCLIYWIFPNRTLFLNWQNWQRLAA